MKKKILVVMFAVGMVTTSLTGCANKHETITINSKSDWIFDDITINLKEGYWIRDYSIDYENGVVTLNLDKN